MEEIYIKRNLNTDLQTGYNGFKTCLKLIYSSKVVDELKQLLAEVSFPSLLCQAS